ncbi:MAG: ferritin family protein, partial [Caldisericaceae bacterium]|nr:ferritin family protein [Caldisericaceae bacterium]
MEKINKNLSFDSTDEILEFAIDKEVEAKEFYEFWAQKVKNAAIKEVLLDFAAEEQNHKELLQKVKAGENLQMPKTKIIDLKLGEYFVEVGARENMNYEESLRVAIQREIGAKELYTYLASIATNQPSKELFER